MQRSSRRKFAKSRKGRRPMRVSTMLRKEKEGSLYKYTKLGSEERLQRLYTLRGLDENGEVKTAGIKDLPGVRRLAAVLGTEIPGTKGIHLPGFKKLMPSAPLSDAEKKEIVKYLRANLGNAKIVKGTFTKKAYAVAGVTSDKRRKKGDVPTRDDVVPTSSVEHRSSSLTTGYGKLAEVSIAMQYGFVEELALLGGETVKEAASEEDKKPLSYRERARAREAKVPLYKAVPLAAALGAGAGASVAHSWGGNRKAKLIGAGLMGIAAPASVLLERRHQEKMRKEADVTKDEARMALKRLKKLEKGGPSRGELLRGAGVGALAGPLAAGLSSAIAGTRVKGIGRGLRAIAGQSATGAIYGGIIPSARHKLEQGVEKQKLKDYIDNHRRSDFKSKARRALGV